MNPAGAFSDPRAADGRWPDLLWWLAALALAVALAVPFLLVDVPPVLDYPNHLARLFVLAHPDDPVLSQIYAPHWRIVPNLGIDVLGTMLLKVVPVHVGGRLLLALSLFAPVIGVVVYHRVAFGRFALWPLASGVMATNGIFHLGFMNFLLSLGLALLAAATWRMLRRRSPWLATGVGALLVTAIFLTHLFGVILFAMLIGAEEAVRLWRYWRSRLLTSGEVIKTAAQLALVLSPAAVLFALCPLAEGHASIGAWRGLQKIWALFTPAMSTSVGLTLATGIAVFCIVILLWRRARWAPGAWLLLGALAMAFVLAPSTIKNGTFVDVRLGLMIGLVLFATMDPRLDRREAIVVGLIFAALIGIRSMYISSTWIAHRGDLADIRSAIASVEPGAKVLVARGQPGNVMETPKPARSLPGVYRLDGHLGAMLAIERKAFWPLMFADPSQQPLDIRPAYKAISASLDEPVDLPYLQTDDSVAPGYIRNWRRHFDRVLLIDAPTPLPVIDGLALVQATPYAALYRVIPKP
jgi:hypothetical protein